MKALEDRKVFSFVERAKKAVETTTKEVRESKPCVVSSYLELAERVAELQFRNPGHVLLFRGQSKDHFVNGMSSLRPSLFRDRHNRTVAGHNASIERKFRRLAEAERLLLARYPASRDAGEEMLFVQRVRIVRWAIIQHYDMCPTPLLDLTHSLRIAASFASFGQSSSQNAKAFLFVVAVPQISGAVTVDVENGVQLVRLSAVCPPNAMRPHLQEGYLIGEYPDLYHYDQKALYRIEEVDFGHRLVAKFQFDVRPFWSSRFFPIIDPKALLQERDPFFLVANDIRNEARRRVPPM